MGFLSTVLAHPSRLVNLSHGNDIRISKKLVESAHANVTAVLQQLNADTNGLTEAEVKTRLERYGPNEVAREKRQSLLMRLMANVKNPLVILLSVLLILAEITKLWSDRPHGKERTNQLERRTAEAGLGAVPGGLETKGHRRGAWRDQRSGQPMDQNRQARR